MAKDQVLAGLVRGGTNTSRVTRTNPVKPPRCAYCNTLIKPGQVTKTSRRHRVFHLACLFKAQAKSSNNQAQRTAEREEREALSDAAAEESMRGHKPPTWRLGKSPSDYGRR
ncbi:hypothetical protein [Streptomyces sp. CC224B]|uniref:hypothetical protein n=1 Tax=Streptomyces sp. CC224B TaxID=3044571 RepID=UPI0024A8AFE4|nr:hypothetical protein [Streptomyces sp. CC224B]